MLAGGFLTTGPPGKFLLKDILKDMPGMWDMLLVGQWGFFELGFEGRLAQLVKNLPAMRGSIPGLGRSPGEGIDYPLQYSGLENSMDCIVLGTATERLSLPFHFERRDESNTSRRSGPSIHVCVLSCVRLCDPMDCSLPGSSLRGTSQSRILEWAAISFSRGSS